MKKHLLLSIVLIALFASFAATAQVPQRTGWWKFDDASDFLKAEIGSPLELTGTIQESISSPAAGNLAVEVPLGSYFAMTHGISPNGGGTLVNEYTLLFDFSVPEIPLWYAFFETAAITSDDADLFIAKTENSGIGRVPNSIGTGSVLYTANTVEANTWYRMIVSVKNGEFFRIYVNGELWLDSPNIQDVDGRYGLAPTIYIFQDGDGDDGTLSCSELCIWDVALSDAQALELGDASTVLIGIRDNKIVNTSDLSQNYPNPVSHNTTFPYRILKTGDVTFRVLDVTGKEIQVIREGVKSPGKYTLNFNSDKLTNGVFYVRMTANNLTSVRKMVIIR